jgi:phosphomevalonate kinase
MQTVGTQIYRRFTGENFVSCMEESVHRADLFSAVACSPDKWDQEVRPLHLPSYIDIVLGDVCGGSSSTAMVRTKT